MEITFQLPPLLIALHTHGCKTTGALHAAGCGGEPVERVCQQPGGKAALDSRGRNHLLPSFCSKQFCFGAETSGRRSSPSAGAGRCPAVLSGGLCFQLLLWSDSLCHQPPKDPPSALQNDFFLQQCTLPASSFSFQTRL